MKKDVIISIRGKQELGDPEADVIELTTAGRFYRRGRAYYVSYEESEMTGLLGTRTTLKVQPDTVSVIRTGLSPSQLVFERGKRHVTLYHTEYGSMEVAVSTERIEHALTDEGGTIDVRYAIEIDHVHASVNELSVSVRDA